MEHHSFQDNTVEVVHSRLAVSDRRHPNGAVQAVLNAMEGRLHLLGDNWEQQLCLGPNFQGWERTQG